MPPSIWNKHTFSIATDELSALTHDEFTTVMGALVIDLVSAPIPSGPYDIRLTAIVGVSRYFFPPMPKYSLMARRSGVASGYIMVRRSRKRCGRHSPIPRSMCRRLYQSGQQPRMRNIRSRCGLRSTQLWVGHKFTS
jgi:hypothetical protein